MPMKSGFAIIGLSHLLLQVKELPDAEHFYCDLLGLTIKSRGTFGGARPLTVTHQGVGMTPLPESGGRPPSSSQHNLEHLALWVKGIDSIVAKLRAEGISVDDPKQNEYGLSTSVRDPDGNRVELIERIGPG